MTTFIPRQFRRPAGEWAAEGACRDVDTHQFGAFYSRHGGRAALIDDRTAKAICATCPVSSECLTHALDMDETDGVWGGMTAAERRRLVARRRAARRQREAS